MLAVAALMAAPTAQTGKTRLADGFDFPVGKPNGDNYYKSRGFRAGYHLGEDWNGIAGGNSDLGAPVYVIAHGLVVFARDMGRSWGNLVIVRHEFLEGTETKTVDSVYAHLDKILVKPDQQLTRGDQVGTIGTAHGTYPAHLHFEIRKNLGIGYNQRGFAKDLSNYFLPTPFILAHRTLTGGGRTVPVPIGTFGTEATTPHPTNPQASPSPTPKLEKPSPEPKFRVNRYDDSP